MKIVDFTAVLLAQFCLQFCRAFPGSSLRTGRKSSVEIGPLCSQRRPSFTYLEKAQSRRGALTFGLPAGVIILLGLGDGASARDIMPVIEASPSLDYLIPILELSRSFSNLDQIVVSEGGLAKAKQRLERFFAGGFLSNKYVFIGMCKIYVDNIKYGKPQIWGDNELITQDKLSRMSACETVVNALEVTLANIKEDLIFGANSRPSILTKRSIEEANAGLKNFLGKVPEQDILAVYAWSEAVHTADKNKNRQLEPDELATLDASQAALYKKVGDLVGFFD